MNIIYLYTIYVDKGRLPIKGKYGKISGLEQVHNELSKSLEEFPPGEEKYPGKLLSVNRNTN